jgi:transcriptional regulator with XRE-family HTH domain
LSIAFLQFFGGVPVTTLEFDGMSFYKAINDVRELRGLNWKQISEATGVSASTLTRMGQGKKPDADSLAKLSAWGGINPANFVRNSKATRHSGDTLPQVLALFRADPNLSKPAISALEEMVRAAYKNLRGNK